jgi:hypothetical protein
LDELLGAFGEEEKSGVKWSGNNEKQKETETGEERTAQLARRVRAGMKDCKGHDKLYLVRDDLDALYLSARNVACVKGKIETRLLKAFYSLESAGFGCQHASREFVDRPGAYMRQPLGKQ